jgi:hypothetical protein
MVCFSSFNLFQLISASKIIGEENIDFENGKNFENTIKTSNQRIKESKNPKRSSKKN